MLKRVWPLLIATIFLGLPGVAGQSSSGDQLSCPSTSSQGLASYRDAAIQQILAGNYEGAATSLKNCFHDDVPACFNDMNAYINELRAIPGHHSFDQIGHDSLIDEGPGPEGLTLQSEQDLPPEFQVKNSMGQRVPGAVTIPPNLFEIAKQKGWKVLSYKTRSTGGFDKAPNLTIIAIPGQDKDILMQIQTLPDHDALGSKDDPKPHPSNDSLTIGQKSVTVISLDKTKSPPVGQLRFLSGDGHTYQWSNQLQAQNCISCHTQPFRTISPRGYRTVNGTEKRMSPEDERTVESINAMMIGTGMNWGSFMSHGQVVKRGAILEAQPYAWAPPNSPTRQTDFLKQCTASAPPVDYGGFGNYSASIHPSNQFPGDVNLQKVAANMNCTLCHNGTTRGWLHENFDFNEITFKIAVDRSMPPGANLNDDERLALLNCLRDEFKQVRPQWKESGEWMKRNFCSAQSSSSGPLGSGPLGGGPLSNGPLAH